MSEVARRAVAYAQAGVHAADWARRVETPEHFATYFDNQNRADRFRSAGIWAVGTVARLIPYRDATAVIEPTVLDEHEVIAIGTEAVVIKVDDDEVLKVYTGKTEAPERLAPRLADRLAHAQLILGEHAVDTDISVRKLQVFRGLPAMDHVCASQPNLNIIKRDALEDDVFLEGNEGAREQVSSALTALRQLFNETGLLYDTANVGNVVLAAGASDGEIRLPDAGIVDISQPDMAGINMYGAWGPRVYDRALTSHQRRLRLIDASVDSRGH